MAFTKRTLLAGLTAALMLPAGMALAARHKVTVSLGRTDDTFLTIMAEAVKGAAAAHTDLDVEMLDAKNDLATQISHVKKAIEGGSKVIVLLSVDEDSSADVVKLTQKANVPLVFLNKLPPMDRFEGKVAIVASNDLVAGRLQMRMLSDKIGGGGDIGILRGVDGHPAARDRTIGVKEIVAAQSGLKIVREVTCEWQRDKAASVVSGWFSEGLNITAIAANNDQMALGAIDALKARGMTPGQVAVGGVDGTTEALEEIRSGWLTVSLLQNAKAQAERAMADADKFAKGEYAQLYDWVPYQLIIPANVDRFAV